MIALLSAAGVERSDWYALREERWYPNMGLFAGQAPTPALDSFRTATGRLVGAGRARRVDVGDPLTFIYRFGEGPQILWGSGRTIRWSDPAARAWDSRGRPVRLPDRLTGDPVLVDGGARFTLGPVEIVADTLVEGIGGERGRWTWAVTRSGARPVPMGWTDWNWTSYRGAPGFPNLRVMPNAVAVARPAKAPTIGIVERFAVPAAGDYILSACFEGTTDRPVSVRIATAGRTLFAGKIDGVRPVPPITLPLAGGEGVEIGYQAPGPGAHLVRRRVRVLTVMPGGPALCAPSGSDERRGMAQTED